MNAGNLVSQGMFYQVYHLNTHSYEGLVSLYHVCPGIEVVFLDIKGAQYIPRFNVERNVIEVNHCAAGRAEFSITSGGLHYLGEGDFFVSAMHNYCDTIELPLGYYRGVEMMIAPHLVPRAWLSEILSMDVDVAAIITSLFKERSWFYLQANSHTDSIFDCLYDAAAQSKAALCRLKALELILFLKDLTPSHASQGSVYDRQQIETIKRIRKRMTENTREHYSIALLAREFCMSQTSLKTTFKGVYGMSIGRYMKAFRMKKAAELLRNSSLSIASIAREVGYESQSKFGVAFRQFAHVTPSEYRKLDSPSSSFLSMADSGHTRDGFS